MEKDEITQAMQVMCNFFSYLEKHKESHLDVRSVAGSALKASLAVNQAIV